MQGGHRHASQARRNALDPPWGERNHCPSLFQAEWPLRGFLGASRPEPRGPTIPFSQICRAPGSILSLLGEFVLP